MIVTWVYFRDNREDLKKINPTKLLKVKVEGSVKKPGVYEMQEGTTFQEAIEKAGGSLDEKFLIIHPNEEVMDGQIITIGK
jgi:protein involved in polysaccharide export with SLBB domain